MFVFFPMVLATAQLAVGLTRTICLHDGLWPWGPLSSFPRTTQVDTNKIARGRLQVHQRYRLLVTEDCNRVEVRAVEYTIAFS